MLSQLVLVLALGSGSGKKANGEKKHVSRERVTTALVSVPNRSAFLSVPIGFLRPFNTLTTKGGSMPRHVYRRASRMCVNTERSREANTLCVGGAEPSPYKWWNVKDGEFERNTPWQG